MKVIKGKGTELRAPTRAQVEEIYQKVRTLYSGAYAWEAPELDGQARILLQHRHAPARALLDQYLGPAPPLPDRSRVGIRPGERLL